MLILEIKGLKRIQLREKEPIWNGKRENVKGLRILSKQN